MRGLSEGEKLYWQDQKDAKDRIREEFGIFGLIKAWFLKRSTFLDSWELAEEEMREDFIKKIYKV